MSKPSFEVRVTTLPITVTAAELEAARREPPRLYEYLLEHWAEARRAQAERAERAAFLWEDR